MFKPLSFLLTPQTSEFWKMYQLSWYILLLDLKNKFTKTIIKNLLIKSTTEKNYPYPKPVCLSEPPLTRTGIRKPWTFVTKLATFSLANKFLCRYPQPKTENSWHLKLEKQASFGWCPFPALTVTSLSALYLCISKLQGEWYALISSWAWWCTPLVSTQAEAGGCLSVRGRLGLHWEFQAG